MRRAIGGHELDLDALSDADVEAELSELRRAQAQLHAAARSGSHATFATCLRSSRPWPLAGSRSHTSAASSGPTADTVRTHDRLVADQVTIVRWAMELPWPEFVRMLQDWLDEADPDGLEPARAGAATPTATSPSIGPRSTTDVRRAPTARPARRTATTGAARTTA